MISHLSLIVFALLVVSIVVQSIPLQAREETLVSVKQSATPQKPSLALDQPLDENILQSPAQILTDVKMDPNELTYLQKRRRRRQIHLNDEFRQRRKRALSSFDFLNGDPLYQSWLEHDAVLRPTRYLDSVLRYPFFDERPSRSLLDSPEWNSIEDNPLENGNFVESPLSWVDEQAQDEYSLPLEVDSDELAYLPDVDEPTENYFQ